jgi:hypothetical protein
MYCFQSNTFMIHTYNIDGRVAVDTVLQYIPFSVVALLRKGKTPVAASFVSFVRCNYRIRLLPFQLGFFPLANQVAEKRFVWLIQ